MRAKSVRQVWEEIKGKADFYKTAYITATDECVRIVGNNGDGTFYIQRAGGVEHYGVQELEDFGL